MKRGIKFGFVLSLVVLSIFFVLAASFDLAPSTASAGDTVSLIAFNVSSNNVVNTTNVTNLTHVVVALIGTANINNITNVTISNGTSGFSFSNSTFTASPVNVTLGTGVNISTSNNWTVSFTLSSSATYNKTFGANVTALTRSSASPSNSTLNFSTLPYNSSLVTIGESTNPTAIATCSPSSVYLGEAFPCTCSGTDSGTTDSGIATTSGTSDSPDGVSIPVTIGVFTYTCAVTDNAGNSASATAVYTVLSSGGRSSTPSLPKETHSWAKITPGVAAIMQNFDSDIGVKQIQITVNSEAQNVQIVVTKYDGKPAEVSVSKTGKVYQYLQIDPKNLEGHLNNADVQFRVEKAWASSNGVSKEKLAVYKFDEATSKWNEQTTTYSGEDATYYYYDVSLDSFSYFAISERSLVAGEGVTATGETPEEGSSSLTWLWIVIVVIVLLALWFGASKRKRRR